MRNILQLFSDIWFLKSLFQIQFSKPNRFCARSYRIRKQLLKKMIRNQRDPNKPKRWPLLIQFDKIVITHNQFSACLDVNWKLKSIFTLRITNFYSQNWELRIRMPKSMYPTFFQTWSKSTNFKLNETNKHKINNKYHRIYIKLRFFRYLTLMKANFPISSLPGDCVY